MPRHVAIIMDGNGRWAKSRSLPRTAGHRKGVEAVRDVVKAARELGLPYLTLFGFSAENWRRPETEIFDLMHLLRFYLRSEIAELHRAGIRLRVVGDRTRLAADIQAMIGNAEEMTRANAELKLTIALSYGGRQEIVIAARRLAEEVAAGRLAPEAIDEALFARNLLTGDIPDPDLLIRTSGEKRISNFMLWQCAYTEFVFTDILWPDFTRRELENAIEEFHRRDRRFGAVSSR
jgi:undecaprenyl diphosphate synthase